MTGLVCLDLIEVDAGVPPAANQTFMQSSNPCVVFLYQPLEVVVGRYDSGRKIDCLTFKVWPRDTKEPTAANSSNTEKYYFDITAVYDAL